MRNAIKNAKLFVCDMDGTVYLGERVLDGALEFVKRVKESDKEFLFFTNNASRRKEDYLEKLERLGFGKCELMTSGDVTISYLQRHYPNKTVYVLGTEALRNSMRAEGIKLVDDASADIVVSSFDTELTYEKLCIACDGVRNGAVYLSTHPDYNCPTDGGFIPDSGAIAALITASTGRTPKYLGKPYKETAEAICALKGVEPKECISIGDRLYTDIAMAKNSGMTSILVLSGETKENDVTETNRPDFIVKSVENLTSVL
ncbi:MAG: HAD-IIA family hydrolase [Ruminococcaceae bacterium]|nr:HAD-IIA family hydrolase [Oscillospiraceae bacterium]